MKRRCFAPAPGSCSMLRCACWFGVGGRHPTARSSSAYAAPARFICLALWPAASRPTCVTLIGPCSLAWPAPSSRRNALPRANCGPAHQQRPWRCPTRHDATGSASASSSLRRGSPLPYCSFSPAWRHGCKCTETARSSLMLSLRKRPGPFIGTTFRAGFSHTSMPTWCPSRSSRSPEVHAPALPCTASLLGLLITAAADRSRERIVFTYACASTILLCPLVFGAPTEMWVAHAVFWPALAISLSAPANVRGAIVVCLALLALVFTHEGAVVLAASMLAALLCRGWRDPVFVRACAACALAILVWAAVKLTIRPDDYIAAVLAAATFRFIDLHNLAQPMVLTLCAALAGYFVILLLLRAASIERAHVYASLRCAAALAVFWARFDQWLLAEARYDLRTVLLIGIPILGFVAALETMTGDDWEPSPPPR